MKKILIASLLIILSLIVKGQIGKYAPRYKTVTVFEVTRNEKNKVDCWGVDSTGCTVHIKYGFRGWKGKTNKIKPGTKLRIKSYWYEKYEEWYTTKIYVEK